MVNAKKDISGYQLACDLELTQSTALSMQHRIWAAMTENDDLLLYGLLETEETVVGGKPRKRSTGKDDSRTAAPGKRRS